LGAGLGAAQQGIGIGISLAKIANIGTDKASLLAAMGSVRGMSSGYAAAPNAEAVRLYSLAASFSADDRRAMGDASGGEGLVTGKRPEMAPKPVAPTVPATPADAWDKSGDAWGA
jgi:hypothetical protein